MTLNISDIISVSVVNVPNLLQNFNVNNVALFTNDTPNFVDEYRYYSMPSQVALDFGTDSLTTEMANNLFAQSPNILSAGGLLTIVPMNSAVSATQGTLLTVDLTTHMAAFNLITNGAFNLVLNGNTTHVTGLNFSNVNSISDIITVLQRSLPDVLVSLDQHVDDSNSYEKILFTSKKVGSMSSVSLIAPTGGGTDITGSTYLHIASAITTNGTNSSGEKLKDAINRVQNKTFFVGCLDTLLIEDAQITDTAQSLQPLNQIWLHGVSSTTDIAGIATTVQSSTQTKTRLLLHTLGLQTAQLFTAAYAGRGFSVDFTGVNTALTMNLKSLANVPVDTGMTETLYQQSLVAGVDTYDSWGVEGVSSSGGNDYFDNVYNKIWLGLAMQVAKFNYLKATNGKIPQTEDGMTGFKNASSQVLQQAVQNGVLAIGLTWNSGDTFGDPNSLRRNITEQGYYIYTQPIAQQLESDRQARKAPVEQDAVKFAGAIHSADVIINVEY